MAVLIAKIVILVVHKIDNYVKRFRLDRLIFSVERSNETDALRRRVL